MFLHMMLIYHEKNDFSLIALGVCECLKLDQRKHDCSGERCEGDQLKAHIFDKSFSCILQKKIGNKYCCQLTFVTFCFNTSIFRVSNKKMQQEWLSRSQNEVYREKHKRWDQMLLVICSEQYTSQQYKKNLICKDLKISP